MADINYFDVTNDVGKLKLLPLKPGTHLNNEGVIVRTPFGNRTRFYENSSAENEGGWQESLPEVVVYGYQTWVPHYTKEGDIIRTYYVNRDTGQAIQNGYGYKFGDNGMPVSIDKSVRFNNKYTNKPIDISTIPVIYEGNQYRKDYKVIPQLDMDNYENTNFMANDATAIRIDPNAVAARQFQSAQGRHAMELENSINRGRAIYSLSTGKQDGTFLYMSPKELEGYMNTLYLTDRDKQDLLNFYNQQTQGKQSMPTLSQVQEKPYWMQQDIQQAKALAQFLKQGQLTQEEELMLESSQNERNKIRSQFTYMAQNNPGRQVIEGVTSVMLPSKLGQGLRFAGNTVYNATRNAGQFGQQIGNAISNISVNPRAAAFGTGLLLGTGSAYANDGGGNFSFTKHVLGPLASAGVGTWLFGKKLFPLKNIDANGNVVTKINPWAGTIGGILGGGTYHGIWYDINKSKQDNPIQSNGIQNVNGSGDSISAGNHNYSPGDTNITNNQGVITDTFVPLSNNAVRFTPSSPSSVSPDTSTTKKDTSTVRKQNNASNKNNNYNKNTTTSKQSGVQQIDNQDELLKFLNGE